MNVFFPMKKYPPLVLKLKWPKAIYKIVQYYNEYCVAMLNDLSQSFITIAYSFNGLFVIELDDHKETLC